MIYDTTPIHKIGEAAMEAEKAIVVDKADNGSDELIIEGIDINKALLYCGGLDNYLKIVRGCCEEYRKTRKELEDLYAARDWSGYTIKIHALKSTMRSIGEGTCSEQAYKLEMACKDGNYELVIAEHSIAMELYEAAMLRFARCDSIDADESLISYEEIRKEEKASACTLPPITSEEFDALIKRFEDAMYALDDTEMDNVLSELDAHSYNGICIKDKITDVHKKVGRSDYFSAGDLLASVRKSLG